MCLCLCVFEVGGGGAHNVLENDGVSAGTPPLEGISQLYIRRVLPIELE